MTLRDRPLRFYHLPSSGVKYAPLFEWIIVSMWAGIGWDRFIKLPVRDQNILVAAYREKLRLDAILEYQEQKRASSQAAKPKKRGGGGR